MTPTGRTTDVIVIGGGPTGLLLAGDLAAQGVDVTVVERSAEPDPLPRANGVVGDAVRLLDERGLYRELAGHDRSLRGTLHRIGTRNLGRHPRPAPSFGYAGFRLPLRRVQDRHPVYVLPVPQRALELALERSALHRGAVVRRRHELRSFAQHADGVHAEVATPGGVERLSAAYLVGSDGAHSLVRKQARIELPGATLDGAVSRLAHVTIPRHELTATGALRMRDGANLRAFLPHRTSRGVLTFGSFGSGLTTVSTLEWDAPANDDVPMTVDELRDSVARVVGRPVDLEPPHGSGPHQLRRTSSRNARVAATFRAGRVFLAGDAAHVFTGYGAPALNAGLLDAADLAHRLAAAVLGVDGAGEALDGYDDTRRTQALRTVRHSAVQESLLAPGDDVTARRTTFAARLADPGFLSALADELAGRTPS
ncbi:FAD-dependent oxidoreductase [Promicromonospora sp. NPDC057488]|uniref:FAD-dependent oxidoreductase n=1 Tax=Promicromonospora sp. NPDC057488 TaxID=3346147 RepID=UPI00366E9A20